VTVCEKIFSMKVTINGEIKELEAEVNLNRLLELFSLPQQRVAVELNREVVRRQDWEGTVVADGDRIEVVHFVGGG
jgi:thiamine biosynthesis protein ThiS